MKEILAISYCLPPLLYPQSMQVGRLLDALKGSCNLHVVTADEVGGPRDAALQPGLFDGMASVLRVSRRHQMYVDYAAGRALPWIFNRPDIYRPWMARSFRAIRRAHAGRRFDAIATFSYPASTNLLGLWLKLAMGVRWVAHQSDPWADNPFARISPFTAAAQRRQEAESFAAADALVFTSGETAAMYRERHPILAGAMHVLNHSFDPAAYPPPAPRPARARRLLRYIGSFYGGRSPEPLFAAIASLPAEDRARLEVEIVGGGRRVPALREAHGVQAEVTLRAGVSYRESLRLMTEADLLMVIDAPSEGESVYFPSKLADYIGAARPVLGISPPGASRRILASLGQPCLGTDDVPGIAALLSRIARTEGDPWPVFDRAASAPYLIEANGAAFARLLGIAA